MNYIERDVYVLENRIKEKIDYVRGTNALPIYFHFRDYEIPEGATAKAFVLKPSKKATYNVKVPFMGAPAQRILWMRFTQNNFLNIQAEL